MQTRQILRTGGDRGLARALVAVGVAIAAVAASVVGWSAFRDAPETTVLALPDRSTIPVISVEERRVHRIPEGDDIGPPDGLAVAPDGKTFFVARASQPTVVTAIRRDELSESTITLPSGLASPHSFTFDLATDALIASTQDTTLHRVPLEGRVTTALSVSSAAPAGVFHGGLVFDRANDLAHGLHGTQLLTFDLPPGSADLGRITRRIELGATLRGPGAGLAVDDSGRLFIADPASSSVVLLSRDGDPIQIIDLAASGVGSVLDIAVAASSDTSDSASVSNLYVLDDIVEDDGRHRVIRELTAVRPRSTATAGTVDRATIRQSVALGDLVPPTPDASGITWLPGTSKLLVADSEVDEYDFDDGTNLREIRLDGSVADTASTTAWSREPSDIVFDASRNRLFTSDDDLRRIFEIDVGPDGRPGTGDDAIISSFDTAGFGSTDPEGLTYDPVRGRLHVADGDNKEIFTIDPGADGRFDGAGGDDLIEQFDTESAGLRDPEGVTHDIDNDTLITVDQNGPLAVEFGLNGSILRYIQLDVPGHDLKPAGVTWAPASSGEGRSLWVVERGVDGQQTRDGMLHEFDVPPLGGGARAPIIGVPGAVSFGPVGMGLTARRALTLSNEGTAALEISSIRITGPDADRFSLVGDTGPATVPGGSSIPITVTFSPSEVRSYESNLSVESNALGRPAVVVSLEGGGAVADPRIDVSPRTLRFPTTGVGAQSRRTLTISNRGTAPLTVSGLSIGGETPGVFSVTTYESGRISIPAGRSADVTISFGSATAGRFSAVVTVVSDDNDRRSTEISLSAEARAGAPTVAVDAAAVGGSTRKSAVSTDEALQPVDGQLFLAFVTSKPGLPVRSVAGMGATWTPLRFQCAGRGQTAVSVFVATDASQAGPVTAAFGEEPSSAAIAVVAYSGADLEAPIGAVVAANTNGTAGGCSGGLDTRSFAVTVPTGGTQSLVTGAAATRNRELTPGAQMVPLLAHSAGTGGDASGLSIIARPSDGPSSLTMDGRFDGEADWAFVAVELRVAG